MPIFETYAARLAAAERCGQPDVYGYALPAFLRKQLSQIVTDCIGPGYPFRNPDVWSSPPANGNDYWAYIAKVMDREVQSFDLPSEDPFPYGHCMQYLATSLDINGVLSLVEICCLSMRQLGRAMLSELRSRYGIVTPPAEGIDEINERFLRAGVGYKFESGRIFRIDSQYVHAEVVKDALRLLQEPEFAEANDEFLTAHRHLREGDNLRDCNTAALRAMESVLKTICDARGWTYSKGDVAERLITVVTNNGLFPDYLGGYFTSLIGAMKAGVPKIRDRQGGHGAAPGDARVPEHIAAYTPHLTAANIVMLAKAHKARG